MDKIINTISKLVQYKTVDGNFTEFQNTIEFIEDFFQDTPVFVNKYFFNRYPALVISTKNSKNPEIMLQGHLDVVNGKDDQFNPRIVDGKLYGRGSEDMKGFDAIALHLIKDLAYEYPEIDLGVMLTFDEEIGSENGASKLAELGYGGNILINGDAGYNFSVIHGEKGILKIEISVDAEPGRHPYPWQGKNAFNLLMDDYNLIASLFPNHSNATQEDNWYSTHSIYDINVENNEFYPAHKATAKVNIYFTDDLSVDELLNKILEITKHVSIKKITGSERVYLDPNNDKVIELQKIMEANFERPIGIRTENGSSDARYFTNQGIAIVIIKAIGQDYHGDNEHLVLEYLPKLYISLKEFILKNVSVDKKNNEVVISEI